MAGKVYLVKVDAAAQARARQAIAEEDKRLRLLKRDQIAEFKAKQKAARSPNRKPRQPRQGKKPKREIKYARVVMPYRQNMGAEFYDTREWQACRYKAFKRHGRQCAVCRATDTELHVDHIRPRSKFPHLELDAENLQILCRACNLGKGNSDCIDWRQSGP